MTKTNQEIKSAIKNEKIIIGTKTVMKNLKNGKLEKIIISLNVPKEIKEDLEHYSKISKININEFDGTSVKLGEFCGKPFNILVVGIKK